MRYDIDIDIVCYIERILNAAWVKAMLRKAHQEQQLEKDRQYSSAYNANHGCHTV